MQKQLLLWTMPILLILIIATYLVLSPVMVSHAASTHTNANAPVSDATPNSWFWHP